MSAEKELFYETIARDFDSIMNMYDTTRRINVIFEEMLGNENLNGKTLLDGGCGTGLFTRRAVERGAKVFSLDISESLVKITCEKVPSTTGVVGSLLELPFADNTFDYVISSEVIEHTPDPYKASSELIRVLKPGGVLCITAPNRTFWYFSVVLANFLGLRKYNGYENWVHYFEFKRFLTSKGIELHTFKGIHLFPFVVPALNGILRILDRIFDTSLGFLMVNVAASGIKKKEN